MAKTKNGGIGIQRIVIKIGTHSVIDNGEINYAFLENLGQELRKSGKQRIIVASGSVGFGMKILWTSHLETALDMV